jgi:uncharacterized iron-regulated protein
MITFQHFRQTVTGLLLLVLTTGTAISQHAAYYLFREDGKEVKYEKMMKEASGAEVVLFGELHNNPISHWMQLELTGDLFAARGGDLLLGAEMFEADNQLILNEYLNGFITIEKFEDEAKLWPNYKTDYKPLVEFAFNHHLPFIATNVPRRYANAVFKKGLPVLDSLDEEAYRYMAPLPLEYDTSLTCYSSLIHNPSMPGHSSINLADAQAIKDATMAHFILENWKPGKVVIHFNGAYHSDNFESISWWLKRANPDLRIVTISTVSEKEADTLAEENQGKADFIIPVPADMTTTY